MKGVRPNRTRKLSLFLAFLLLFTFPNPVSALTYQHKPVVAVIDPGHGKDADGWGEPGAVGPSGTREDQVNLAIALYLRQFLRQIGIEPVMTRDENSNHYTHPDIFNRDLVTSLEGRVQRAAQAARASGKTDHSYDFFISIHNNASTSPQARGTMTAYFNPAYAENYSYTPQAALYSSRSYQLARLVQENIVSRLGSYSWGVEPHNYYVLRRNVLPAILVEGLFLSNPKEEKLLQQPWVQANIAHAIFQAVKNYLGFSRIAGQDRIETAIAASRTGWTTSSTVILAVATDYPDALAGTPLAKKFDAPILLNPPQALDSRVLAEIKRLKANKIIILGGPAAISPAVEESLRSSLPGVTITRYGGANRYETAAIIARTLLTIPAGTASTAATGTPVVLATGQNFPDALAVGPYAALRGYPVLLVEQNKIPAPTAELLRELQPSVSYLVGGPAVISSEVEAAVPNPRRIYGQNRYETAVQVCAVLAGNTSSNAIIIASGDDFPDALVAGALSSRLGAPLLLTGRSQAPATLISNLAGMSGTVNRIYFMGGKVAIEEGVENSILAAVPK